jgi:hypothetical protein
MARWLLGVPLVGWANLALVWVFAHQLGIAWRQGAVARWSRARLVTLAAAALGALVVLTGALGYPTSMVGGAGEPRSNTFPPSLAMAALALWQFAAVLALRPPVDRWLARPRAWAAVVTANGAAMTVYLWHLSAMLVVAAVVLPSGWLPDAAPGSVTWWAWRPLWLALCAAALVPLVAGFARVETAGGRRSRPCGARAAVAALIATLGMALLARHGFVAPGMPARLPLVALALVGGGWWLLRPPRATPAHAS